MHVVAPRDVGRPKTENTEQLVVRVPKALRDRLEGLVDRIARPGISTTLTDVVRAALVRGAEDLERETTPAAKPRKR